jgi:hypothetical protein
MPPTERQKMSPAILLAISLILICATILSPSGAVGQSISVAAVGPTRVDFGPQVSGTTSERRVIILTNAGSDALPITQIAQGVILQSCTIAPVCFRLEKNAGYGCHLSLQEREFVRVS